VLLEVIRPAAACKRIQYLVEPSTHGAGVGVNQLRDPFLLRGKTDGQFFIPGHRKGSDLWGMAG
jgi:hypothetical protein